MQGNKERAEAGGKRICIAGDEGEEDEEEAESGRVEQRQSRSWS